MQANRMYGVYNRTPLIQVLSNEGMMHDPPTPETAADVSFTVSAVK